MKKSKLPKIDTVGKLAEFWDNHDLTDFEGELREVTGAVFNRDTSIKVRLKQREAKAIERMAQARRVSPEKLVRGWVLQKVTRRNRTTPARRRSRAIAS